MPSGSSAEGMETLALETAGPVARLALNRPDQRNAMSALLVAELIECLQRIEGDPQIRTIVLSGAGRGFCAGSDLSELAAIDAAGREAFEAESGRLARLIWNLETPVIAAVTGFAIGGGFTLATSCDLVVTAPDAKWSLPEVPIGLFPAWGIDSVVLRAGQVRARRLCWGIDMLDGKAAVEIGLADELADDPVTAACALAQKLAALPPESAAAVKRYFAPAGPAAASDAAANRHFLQCCDTAEAAASFIRYGKTR